MQNPATASRLWARFGCTLMQMNAMKTQTIRPPSAGAIAQFHSQRNLPKHQRLISTSPQTFGGGGGGGHDDHHYSGGYREFKVASKRDELIATIFGAYMWWWIFWHLFTDYGHIIGEFDFPDTDDWSDEELGIPAIDED